MKIAVSFHIGLAMIAFTTSVVQFCPWQNEYSGCSESSKRGVTHVTGGRRPSAMSSSSPSTGNMCDRQVASSSRMCRTASYADHRYPFWYWVAE